VFPSPTASMVLPVFSPDGPQALLDLQPHGRKQFPTLPWPSWDHQAALATLAALGKCSGVDAPETKSSVSQLSASTIAPRCAHTGELNSLRTIGKAARPANPCRKPPITSPLACKTSGTAASDRPPLLRSVRIYIRDSPLPVKTLSDFRRSDEPPRSTWTKVFAPLLSARMAGKRVGGRSRRLCRIMAYSISEQGRAKAMNLMRASMTTNKIVLVLRYVPEVCRTHPSARNSIAMRSPLVTKRDRSRTRPKGILNVSGPKFPPRR
jgi:hypothetical protein